MKTKDREYVLIAIDEEQRNKFLEPLNDAILRNADDEENCSSLHNVDDEESSIRMSMNVKEESEIQSLHHAVHESYYNRKGPAEESK